MNTRLDEHAAAAPTRPAVLDATGVTDYGALAAAVHACADAIHAAGFAPGEVLAVEVADGLPAVVALLAAVRADVPFVWLDPLSPPARREQIVRDCRPAGLLSWRGGPVLSRLPLAPAPVPGDTACVVYTSGSTGAPKGIVQRRVNLDQFVSWFAGELVLAPGARMLQWARLTYDAAYAEILAAIHAGATLVVPAEKSDPARIAELVAAQRVTHLLTVPSLCRALFAARSGVPLPDISSLCLFGEVLPPELLTEAARLVPNAAVGNFYGPTECTLATWFRVPAGFAADVVPIGRPIPGREIQLGADGEILVRTRYLAHGYLRREEETASRFLPDPAGEPGVRVYRTGDLGRLTEDGDLLFVGRVDDQVKIRGVRVQLAEVEAALRTAPDVADAAVRLVDPGQVTARLVAYVCGRPDIGALRRRMTRMLPPAMAPAHYVVLDELPRTVTGKVDRGALPAPPAGPAPRGDPPRGDLAHAIACIWREAIGCPEVGMDIGMDTDFFDVGGYSLLAPAVVTAVRDRLGLTVPLHAVFEHSRLGDFTEHLATLTKENA